MVGKAIEMITRRKLLLAMGIAAVAPASAFAQPKPARVARIGLLSYLTEPDVALAMLNKGLAELGYVEGKSYVIVARYANGDFTRLPKLVGELEAEKIDVLVSRGPSVDFTKAIRARIPVVFAYSGDPVESGFGDSLRRPGRNMLKSALAATNSRHLTTHVYEVSAVGDFDKVFAAIAKSKSDAMAVLADRPFLVSNRQRIVEFAAQNRLPAMYPFSEFMDDGGLVFYGPNFPEMFRRSATYVDKIIKGAKPADLPLEQPTRFEFIVNAKTAKALGLTIPQSLLISANKVIE